MTSPTWDGGQGPSAATAEGRRAGDVSSPSASPTPPAVSLPKGGGAIRGIGETFAANPVTGTGGLSVPLAVSPGRSGFGPSLALAYDSGGGSGPFGFGWSLSLPVISRKTDKGLPRYRAEPEDTFILSGAEDLVPVLHERDGTWRPVVARRSVSGREYDVRRYRPRVEGLFARIERWTDLASGSTHWRSITSGNLTSVYGRTAESRISDPDDPTRVFSWLICESYDDRGNAVVFEYKAEDGDCVDTQAAHEDNRTLASRSANRYPKRIKYGNRMSRLVEPDLSRADWLFEVVFDYGEHDPDDPRPAEARPWPCRLDPFSSYRAVFEIRTYRLCRRVLMFHHVPQEEGVGRDCLVRSTDITYRHDSVASVVTSIVQHGYRRRPEGGYLTRSLPPLELTYSEAVIDERPREVDAETLQNLPAGLDEAAYRLVDLDGEGLSGVLTNQASAWFYKANLGEGRFGPVQLVATVPSHAALAGGRQELLDLAGNGQLDLVDFQGATPGFFERTEERGWAPFLPFQARPVVDWDDPHLRFVDLSGDGHADLLFDDGDAPRWHLSLAEQGFGAAHAVRRLGEVERGLRFPVADPTHTVYLADMSGDGLADVVRIGNGEVCYWPNMGYGRFGAPVSMDGAPWLDEPDQFDHQRIRLADIDGSGPTDLVYLHRDGIRIYANLAGNGWGPVRQLGQALPGIDSAARVTVVDLLGNGTACLVWSSPLPGVAGQRMRYVDLMGGQKPHLLTAVRDNMGAETHVTYAPSTRFYLADKAAGWPWVTRLPFPVHVVERVEIADRVSRNRFVTRYSYHHGFYDGVEREFRGFGMVEQFDTESFAALSVGGGAANLDEATHVPPVLTRTWFHTGFDPRASGAQASISRRFADEYYREADHGDAHPDEFLLPDVVLPSAVRRPGRDPLPWPLSPDEQRQACRALRGSALREETYALDGSEATARPYAVSERDYTIELLQPAADGGHPVFSVHQREAVTVHYERALYPVGGALRADPRVGHELVLAVDDFGNVVRAATVAYGRRHLDQDPALTVEDRRHQRRCHLLVTDNRYTNPVDDDDAYRIPQPAERRVQEVLGLERAGGRPGSTNLFGFAELAAALDAIQDELPYEPWDADPASLPRPAWRLIEHSRTSYRRDDLTGPLALGVLEPMGLPFESYRLALPDGLLTSLYGRRVDAATLDAAGYVHQDGGRWVPSGQVFYSPGADVAAAAELDHARRHFFLAHRFRDPFGSVTEVGYDRFDLLVTRNRDALDNVTTAENDYRVLQARVQTDPNGDRAEVAFDALGMVVGTAVMGRSGERLGDSLAGFDPDPDPPTLAAYFADLTGAHDLLGDATTRLVYDLFAYRRSRDREQPQPAVVATMARETHALDLADGERTRIQHSFVYSDGFDREIQQKAQAEPGPLHDGGPEASPRWVGSGWTIYNNKGRPVRRYEPFFSAVHRFEFAAAVGVSPVLFYDPAGRVVATLHPNDTWQKVVFDPWHQATWDVNDTVLLHPGLDADIGGFVRPYLERTGGWCGWHTRRAGGELGAAEQAAAAKTAAHAGTPTKVWLDTVGRQFLTVAHNRLSGVDEFLATRVRLDIEGNQREVQDAVGRLEARYGYDLLGRRVLWASMDGGERLQVTDAAGKPLLSWNSRGFRTRVEYDALRRPTGSFVQGGGVAGELLTERIVYGEGEPDQMGRRLRTRVSRRFDAAGVITSEAYDFKGNLLGASRQLAVEYRHAPDWAGTVSLEDQRFTSRAAYDALDRPVAMTTADNTIVRPGYNEAGLLERLEANLRGAAEATIFVADVDYNARGQRTLCVHGNGAGTSYGYDPLTFRLTGVRTLRGDEPVQDLGYTYDPAGNITHLRDGAQQTIFFRNRRVEPSADYTYDAGYRLVEAIGREHLGKVDGEAGPVPPSQTDAPRIGLAHPGDGNAMGRYVQRYLYDGVGNLLEMVHRGTDPAHPGWTRAYRYAEPSQLEPERRSNRLTSTSDDGEGTPRPFAYDAHGNVTSMPQLPLMAWDHDDRLAASARQVVTDGGIPETTYYLYDASGQRVRKVTERQSGPGGTPSRRSERIYLGALELYRAYGAAGDDVTLERETLHVLDGERRVALVETRTAREGDSPAQLQRYQFANHLGSACLELDAQARVVSYEEFYPYGSTSYQAVRRATETPKRYRFTGKERDEENGLSYHGSRYYAPWLGRWVAPDPKLFDIVESDSATPADVQQPADGDSGVLPNPTTDSSPAAGADPPAPPPEPYSYASSNPVVITDPDGRAPERVGFIYTLRAVVDGEDVLYTGQTGRELVQRLFKDKHKWRWLANAATTTIEAHQITAELNVAASSRGTLASAKKEALSAAEQVIIKRRQAEGIKVLNAIAGAEEANILKFGGRHAVKIGARFTFRPATVVKGAIAVVGKAGPAVRGLATVAGKVVAKLLRPLAIVLNIREFVQDPTIETASSIAGSLAGAAVGAKYGALLGAPFGPVGSAVGAAAGGIIGGIVGSEAGRALGRGLRFFAETIKKSPGSLVPSGFATPLVFRGGYAGLLRYGGQR
jgi:RHS repeat-associated protein